MKIRLTLNLVLRSFLTNHDLGEQSRVVRGRDRTRDPDVIRARRITIAHDSESGAEGVSSAVRRLRHAVADAALVEDAGGVGRAVAELVAEVADEDAHQICIGVLAVGPDRAQQLVLGGRQLDRVPADRRPALP